MLNGYLHKVLHFTSDHAQGQSLLGKNVVKLYHQQQKGCIGTHVILKFPAHFIEFFLKIGSRLVSSNRGWRK